MLMDGTFKSCPITHHQLFTFHGEIFGSSYPFIYISMKSKNKESYLLLFKFLREKGLNPKYAISDFEMAIISAFKLVFPE
jgi:hypothetical protein